MMYLHQLGSHSSGGRELLVVLAIVLALSSETAAFKSVVIYRFIQNGTSNRSPILFAVSESTNQPEQRYRPETLKAATAKLNRVPYGEESRKYRRTVFTDADWIKHRNSERIIPNLKGMLLSGIVRQIQQEVLLVSLVSAAVVLLNNSGIVEISLPALPFQLCSQALGLLLVFRTNASYARWSEGREQWCRMISNSRNMVRMAATFTDLRRDTAKRKKKIRRLAQAAWLFNRSLMNLLLSSTEDEDEYCKEVRRTLDDAILVERILASRDRTNAAMAEMSLALDQLMVDEKRRVEIDKSLVLLANCLATCEKIYSSPVPLAYTRHTARFLSFWMLLLPAALYEPFVRASGTFPFKGFAVIPAVTIVAIFLFGIEELAVALEEPFSILPMQYFCDEVKESCNTMMEWCFESAQLETEQRKQTRLSKFFRKDKASEFE